jgi:hypothetical protein
MAWVITEPTDSTKIRNLGIVIRPNWAAIDSGDATFKPKALNFADRTVAGIAVDPTAIADAFIMYCKTDTAGNSELYGINETSGILQFTRGVPTVGTSGSLFLVGGVILKWGQFTMSGTSWPVSYVGGAFPTNTLCVNLSPMNSTAASSNYRTGSWSAGSFNIHTNSVSGAMFTYIAIGS